MMVSKAKTKYEAEDLAEQVRFEMRKAIVRLTSDGMSRNDSIKVASAMSIAPAIGFMMGVYGSKKSLTESDCETLINEIFGKVKQLAERSATLSESKGE